MVQLAFLLHHLLVRLFMLEFLPPPFAARCNLSGYGRGVELVQVFLYLRLLTLEISISQQTSLDFGVLLGVHLGFHFVVGPCYFLVVICKMSSLLQFALL